MANIKPFTDKEIIKLYGTENMYFLDKDKKDVYLVNHYSSGPYSGKNSGRGLIEWFNNPEASASADFVVDDYDAYQYNQYPLRQGCFAVGGSKYNTNGGRLYGIAPNYTCISLEIVSNNKTGKITYPNDPSYWFNEKTLNNAIRMNLYLMEKYKIPLSRVIRHYDVNGKECPGVIGWNGQNEKSWKHFLWCIEHKVTWDTPEETVSVQTEKKKKVWAIQIGSFEDKNNADAFLKIVRGTYSDAYIVEKVV